MITIKVVGDTQVIARFDSMSETVLNRLNQDVTTLALEAEARTKQKLSGDVLNVKTGNLRRSIANEVTRSPQSVLARVFSSGDVKYAAAQEFGSAPHDIYPKAGGVLAFEAGGRMVFTKVVHHPGTPPRSFLRSTLSDMRSEIEARLTQSVQTAVKQ